MADTDKDDRQASATPSESAAPDAHASGGQAQPEKKQSEQKNPADLKNSEDSKDQKDSGKEKDGLTALGKAKKEAADYLAALQRERADFINYRNRMDKEKQLARDYGIQDVLMALLPALDDLDRLREHGDMSKEIATVSQQLTRGFDKFKIQKFGKKGEAFDPTRHEAILHRTSSDVDKPQIDAVVEAGYSLNGRILRAAKVVVVAPEEKADKKSADTSAEKPSVVHASDAGKSDAGKSSADESGPKNDQK